MRTAIQENSSFWSQVDDAPAPLTKGVYMLLVDLVWMSFGMAVFLCTCYCMHVRRRGYRLDESNRHSEHNVKDQGWSVEDDLRLVTSEMVSLPTEKVIKEIGRSFWKETVERVAILLQREAEEFEANRQCPSAARAPSVNTESSRPRYETREDSEGCSSIAQIESSRTNDVKSNDVKDISASEERCLQERTSTGDNEISQPGAPQPQDVASGANGSDRSYGLISFNSLSPQSSPHTHLDSTCPSRSVVSSPASSPDFEDVSIGASPGSMIELEFRKESDTTSLIWK